MPSLGSVLPRWKPARVVSMRKAVMPRAPLSGSVIANSTMYFATGPEVIQLFLPLTTKLPSACFTARQRIAVASEPDCVSVRANEPHSPLVGSDIAYDTLYFATGPEVIQLYLQ